MSFHVYPADKNDTSGGAEYAGKILKVPKSMAVEMFTDADTFGVTFPKKSKYEHKGLLIGTAIFLNANFFERAVKMILVQQIKVWICSTCSANRHERDP